MKHICVEPDLRKEMLRLATSINWKLGNALCQLRSVLMYSPYMSCQVSRTGRLSSSREAGSTSGTAYSRQLCPRTNLGDTIGIYPACLAAHKLMRLQCPWCRTYIPNELVCDTRCQVQVLDHLTYHNKNRSTCQRRLTIRISETKQNNTNYFTLVITVVVSSDGVCQQIKVMELEDSLK
ncbi:uncharacterized protein LOC114323379 isoform X2 [Camellia sinensis]|uniref:uncharacterized protein LOC114323379 isoform X2 n=1 Tax=Camellia sinensis TaxID=4442 RepID=UPI0010357FA1|nr:uncharacterized protein LOC114323379 isoform X2 [Camellia sinensis]